MAETPRRMAYVTELEGLRGLMALWVLLGHWTASIPIHIPASQTLFNVYAVYVFVLLSGFVITFLIEGSREPYLPYLVRRALRLAPAYFVYLLLSAALLPMTIEALHSAPQTTENIGRLAIAQDGINHWPIHLLLHAVGLHALAPPALLPNAEYAILGQAWSISLEWQFYLVAPIFILLLKSAWQPRSIIALILIAIFCMLTAGHMPRGYLGNSLWIFGIGIGSYFLLYSQYRGWLPASRRFYMGSAALVFAWLLSLRSWDTLPFLVWTAMMAVLLINRSQPLPWTVAVSRMFDWGPVQWLGRLSYSLYLSHTVFLSIGMWLLGGRGLAPIPYSAALLAITLGGTLPTSWIVYRLIEQPCIDWGKRLARRHKLPGEQPVNAPGHSATGPG